MIPHRINLEYKSIMTERRDDSLFKSNPSKVYYKKKNKTIHYSNQISDSQSIEELLNQLKDSLAHQESKNLHSVNPIQGSLLHMYMDDRDVYFITIDVSKEI